MNEKKEFKNLQITWSYITTCTYVLCPNCKMDMIEYTELKKDDDNVDFGDIAECKCGNHYFSGRHTGKI